MFPISFSIFWYLYPPLKSGSLTISVIFLSTEPMSPLIKIADAFDATHAAVWYILKNSSSTKTFWNLSLLLCTINLNPYAPVVFTVVVYAYKYIGSLFLFTFNISLGKIDVICVCFWKVYLLLLLSLKKLRYPFPCAPPASPRSDCLSNSSRMSSSLSCSLSGLGRFIS